jgi:putative Ca2+/H+ antiporter (TMEM165/GDT1 family)
LLALWAVTLVAALSGSSLARFLTPPLLKSVSVALFTVIGLTILYSAIF